MKSGTEKLTTFYFLLATRSNVLKCVMGKNSQIKVAVLTGGIGFERDVSLQSGRYVYESLKRVYPATVFADISPDELAILDDRSIDMFFLAMHGEFAEDGRLQQILEERSLKYTGSGPRSGRDAFDKIVSKKTFSKAGINTPVAIEFNQNTDTAAVKKQFDKEKSKYVVKPVRQGSSVGVQIVTGCDDVIAAAKDCLKKFGDCMIEEFIVGREFTVGILGDQALPIIEIRPKQNFYDYQAKYIDKKTEFLFNTINDEKLIAKINERAIACFDSLGCRDFARVDFILDENKNIYALEINTLPGLTMHSLVPKSAHKAGYSMSELCVNIIDMALERN